MLSPGSDIQESHVRLKSSQKGNVFFRSELLRDTCSIISAADQCCHSGPQSLSRTTLHEPATSLEMSEKKEKQGKKGKEEEKEGNKKEGNGAALVGSRSAVHFF